MEIGLAHFAMRAVKTIYRPGKNAKNAQERKYIITHSFSNQDKSVLNKIKGELSLIDRTICSLIIHDRIIILDFFLTAFFRLRYNKILRRLYK